MAAPAVKSRRGAREAPSFAVVVKRELGRVTFDDNGGMEQSPMQAAFELIARDGDAGEYEFVVPRDAYGGDHDLRFGVVITTEPVNQP